MTPAKPNSHLRNLILGSILLSPLAMLADGSISGQAISKQTGNPVDFATVQLIDAKTGKPLTIGTMTDEQGRFTIPGVKDGKYLVRISSVGFIDNERPATVAGSDITLQPISLADDSKLLQEVVVEGVRSQMRFELDRKVFQVDANVVAAGQSASELLESIPSVEVDQDGEVSLRGDSSVTVWINGKESGLTADNRAQILEQIPGETIERIEVITNPSAKYSPEGTAGIINIVLKADRRGGYFGSAELGVNSRGGGNAGFNFNYNSSKWEAYASLGFRMRRNKGGSTSERTYDEGYFSEEMTSGIAGPYYQNQDATSHNRGNNLFLRAGATYHPTTSDAIYLNAYGMFGHRNSNSDTHILTHTPYQPFDEHIQLSRMRSNNRGAHVELGYTRTWSPDHTLDFLIGYNHWGGPQENYYLETIGSNPDLPMTSESRFQQQNIHLNSIEAKIDYTKKLLPWLKLEAGYNGNYSHENTPVSGSTGTSRLDLAVTPYLYNTFIYQNNISALYLTLGGKVKDFSFSAGLRGEAWQVRTRSLDFDDLFSPLPTGVTDRYDLVPLFKKNDFALFPSVFLSYSLPHDNEIQINYTRRIRRPWGGQLNSFVDISDPTAYSYGNPQLEPQYSNSYELNYIKSFPQHIISLSAYIRTSDNMMNRVSYLYEGMLYTTNVNVASEVNTGAEIVVKNNLFKILDLTTTLNLYNNRISGWQTHILPPEGFVSEGVDLSTWGLVSGKRRDSFAWDLRVMAGLRLPWGLNFQATGRYASKMLTAQGSRQGGWSVDAGIRKNLGDWSFSLNCRDIFDSRKFKSTIDGDGYTQYSKRWRGGRTLSLTVKYSFGNMKARPDRNRSSEPMDESGYGGEME